MRNDLNFIRLALRLARRGYGMTSPNPMVGAVLVKGGKIIGRGWHRPQETLACYQPWVRLNRMSDKQAALEAIARLPDEISFRDIAKELEFLAAVREGEAQADQGRVIPLAQVEQNLQSWLSKSS